ncbi:sensor histidine kinase [Longitalea arenae]|uniref:sensor histidine kinase n=1 Tax=Longitalea arenae TaxID=2812558 RepID=UPI0019686925|nr:histidine kinase [Longitalea arenae]
MKTSLVSVLFLLVWCSPLFSQEHSYSRYDSKEGLAGSTVYCMTQDAAGFMWFGTETGLSRFDGTHFSNFSMEDGLPDNEVIQLFGDSKGRVWIAPFRKTICYYYKGKIYNRENDPLLKKLPIRDNIVHMAEDNEGNILLQELARLHLIKPGGEAITITTIGNKPLDNLSVVGHRKAGGFYVVQNDSVMVLQNNRFTLWKTVDFGIQHFNHASLVDETLVCRTNEQLITVASMQENGQHYYPYKFKAKHVNYAVIDHQYIGGCTREGAWVYDRTRPDSVQHYLPGITVSNIFKDSEGNWWFSTFGNGVYRLNSPVVLNLKFTNSELQDNQVESLLPFNGWVLAATTMLQVNRLSAQTGRREGRFSFSWPAPKPVLLRSTVEKNRILLGTKHFLVKLASWDPATYSDLLNCISVKALQAHGEFVLVATEKNVLTVDQKTLKVKDTLWHDRATCLFSNNETIYIGTLNGLYQIGPDKKAHYLGDQLRAFQGRIAAVREDSNHIVWVATAGEGLIAWQNGRLLKHITRTKGLTSNICRALHYSDGLLWVGTDKGLNKVNVQFPGFPIQKYTISDGLLSDIINDVCVVDKKVFVATPEGVTFFDEEKIAGESRCDLRFVDITIGGKTYHPADAPSLIPHDKNNIRFNYVGISYKSNGNIRYRYRLLGLDSSWNETQVSFLNYPTLPSGDYELQLQAINKFDVPSKMVLARFTIEKLLYEKTWFRVLAGLLFLAATGLTVTYFIRRIHKREQEKTAISKRIGELEQLSRKAQMNPHFIFNSLNSIQQYVMDSDVAGANKFISGFSRLIRQTLDFSSKPEISLEEELDYLTNYLELERTRLEDAFTWSVIIDEAVIPGEYYIPPMILQPFVENSVRHGLRYRRDKNGIVTISVKREGGHLICILEDNGIGRKAAREYKSISPINYQSKGLSLTADRITMFNKEHEEKISMKIDDLEDNDHQALGTRVTICFPVL